MGGIGKTALALETALRKAHRFEAFAFATAKAKPDFGPLDALHALADATGRPLGPDETEHPVPALTRRLNSTSALLILDNLETVETRQAQELTKALRNLARRIFLPGLPVPWTAALQGLVDRTFGHPKMIRLAVAMAADKGWHRTTTRLDRLRGTEIEEALQDFIGTMVDNLETRNPKAIDVLHACSVFREAVPLRDLRHVVLGEPVDDDSDAAIDFEDGPLQAAL